MAFNVTIGQYYRTTSVIHRLDPRLKLILTFCFSLLVFLSNAWITSGILLGVILLVTAAAQIPLGVLLRSVRVLLGFVLFTALANLFFVRSGTPVFTWWIISITDEALSAATFLSLRFSLLMLAGSLLALTTSPVELTDAAEHLSTPLKRFGFPAHEMAMVLSIAMRFVPTLSVEAQRIIRAQRGRGATFSTGSPLRRIKALVPILIPLFSSSINHAERLARAMEARCYTGGEGRTHFHELKMKRADYLSILIFVLLFAVILGLRLLW